MVLVDGAWISDSDEEEEKETVTAHISDPKDNAVGSFVNPKMPEFPSRIFAVLAVSSSTP